MITTRMDRNRKRLEALINISGAIALGGSVLALALVFVIIFALITVNSAILSVMLPIFMTVFATTIISGVTYGFSVCAE